MKINQKLLIISIVASAIACGGGNDAADGSQEPKVEAQSMYEKAPDPMENPGVGPIKELVLPTEIDQEMAKKGEEIYVLKCTACHKPDQKYIGPSPQGIFERRNPAWVMNMILNPEVMIVEDPIAKKLLMEYNGSPMANQNLTQEEARAIVEYFRTL